jgi:steroid 5-alpha reductase family enzyme
MQADPVVTVFVILGAGIWLIGMICEIVADQQLARFLSDPRHRGKLMTSGIWRYSRHPNYFGEMMIWWGIAIIGLGYPLSAVGIIGALIITLILAFVSGIPLAEKGASTKPGWKAYKAQTSVLIPLPPK